MKKGGHKFARIQIFPAADAPVALVVRRRPSRWSHISIWNTESDEIQHLGYVHGRIYEKKTNISPDGNWFVYFALGYGNVETGTVLCRSSSLEPMIAWPNDGTYVGGGYWESAEVLIVDEREYALSYVRPIIRTSFTLPFKIKSFVSPPQMLLRILSALAFKGELSLADTNRMLWQRFLTPSEQLPQIQVREVYGTGGGYPYEFTIPEFPGFLDIHVTWAAYDSKADLLVARSGALQRYKVTEIPQGPPVFSTDLENLPNPTD